MFIDVFYSACEELQQRAPEIALPDAARINRILTDRVASFQIDPLNLVVMRTHIPIAVPDQAPSLDVMASIYATVSHFTPTKRAFTATWSEATSLF